MAGIDESREFKPLNVAVLTVSDTRTPENDTSGDLLCGFVTEAGHTLVRRDIAREDVANLAALLNSWVDDPAIDVIITTGGTGVTGRDVTPEAYAMVCEKDIPGFGELFRYLSYQTIGTSTVQSRATAGVARGTYLFALPGSNGAVKDGWNGILRDQLDSRHRPCNFAELIPRLKEGQADGPGTNLTAAQEAEATHAPQSRLSVVMNPLISWLILGLALTLIPILLVVE